MFRCTARVFGWGTAPPYARPMRALAWTGIGTLWLAAAVIALLVVANATGDDGTAEAATDDGTYDFIVFASPSTEALLADSPEDAFTASEMPLDVLQTAYDQSYVITSFEVRPSQILRGGCKDQLPCVGNLHEDEPAIAYSRRTPHEFGAGETVVHPFSPRTFHGILALRTDNARGIGFAAPPAGSQ